MTLTCCQDHILTEKIWFVWSETSYSGDERRCYRCGTNEQQRTLKIELVSPWMIEAEFRNDQTFVSTRVPPMRVCALYQGSAPIGIEI